MKPYEIQVSGLLGFSTYHAYKTVNLMPENMTKQNQSTEALIDGSIISMSCIIK